MCKIKDITSYLESIAPLSHQESYDNAGLITGNDDDKTNGVLIALDCTEVIVDEAIEKGCNLIVAHHPIIFRGLKKITGKNYVERTIIKAIKNDIAIYAIHTNLDNVINGVNKKISEKIGLADISILHKKKDTLSKLVTFVPKKNTGEVLDAIHKAGAGNIGNYENCSFMVEGTGTFKPNDMAIPNIGAKGVVEKVNEDRIEVVFPSYLQNTILLALRSAHPYEEVAYYISTLENSNQGVGPGVIGELPTSLSSRDFLALLKNEMNLNIVRHTAFHKTEVKRIAICGGSGSFLLQHAISANADVFITADVKYHEFFDAEEKITICDIGHYESEVFTKDLIFELLNKKFSTFALCLSKVNTNPISYF